MRLVESQMESLLGDPSHSIVPLQEQAPLIDPRQIEWMVTKYLLQSKPPPYR